MQHYPLTISIAAHGCCSECAIPPDISALRSWNVYAVPYIYKPKLPQSINLTTLFNI